MMLMTVHKRKLGGCKTNTYDVSCGKTATGIVMQLEEIRLHPRTKTRLQDTPPGSCVLQRGLLERKRDLFWCSPGCFSLSWMEKTWPATLDYISLCRSRRRIKKKMCKGQTYCTFIIVLISKQRLLPAVIITILSFSRCFSGINVANRCASQSFFVLVRVRFVYVLCRGHIFFCANIILPTKLLKNQMEMFNFHVIIFLFSFFFTSSPSGLL